LFKEPELNLSQIGKNRLSSGTTAIGAEKSQFRTGLNSYAARISGDFSEGAG
jgi:hypothetical protein